MGGEGPCGFLVALRVRKGDLFLGFSTRAHTHTDTDTHTHTHTIRKGNFPGAPVA